MLQSEILQVIIRRDKAIRLTGIALSLLPNPSLSPFGSVPHLHTTGQLLLRLDFCPGQGRSKRGSMRGLCAAAVPPVWIAGHSRGSADRFPEGIISSENVRIGRSLTNVSSPLLLHMCY